MSVITRPLRLANDGDVSVSQSGRTVTDKCAGGHIYRHSGPLAGVQ
jgi:hypothetical protein